MNWVTPCRAVPCAGRKSAGSAGISKLPPGTRHKRPAADLIPVRPTLASARAAAKNCQACDLYKQATQTVFGEGAPKASLMLIGEQPGDAEDLAGDPFVGPAGKLPDRALEDAGIERASVYVTNVV